MESNIDELVNEVDYKIKQELMLDTKESYRRLSEFLHIKFVKLVNEIAAKRIKTEKKNEPNAE